jgi:hypothetical protein
LHILELADYCKRFVFRAIFDQVEKPIDQYELPTLCVAGYAKGQLNDFVEFLVDLVNKPKNL